MNTVIVWVLFALLGIGGYEFYLHHQQTSDYVEKRTVLTAQIAKLKQENKDLADEQDALTAKLSDLQKQAADLNTQIAAAQGKGVATPPDTDSSSPTNVPTPAPSGSP